MFFTYIFVFLCAMAFCASVVKNPVIGVVLAIVIVVALVTSIISGKERKELIEKSVERVRKELEEMGFIVGKEIFLTIEKHPDEVVSSEIIIDYKNKRIALCSFYTDELKIISFQMLANCEIIEDDNIICSFEGAKKSKSQLVIGQINKYKNDSPSVRNLSVKIITSDSDETTMPVITKTTIRKSLDYIKAKSTAETAYSTLSEIIRKARLYYFTDDSNKK